MTTALEHVVRVMTLWSTDTQIALRLCLDVRLPTKGWVSKGGQRFYGIVWWKQSRSSDCCTCKGATTQQGQKSKSGLLFWLLVLWVLRKAQCYFLNTSSERRSGSHRPADLLRAGVSQIRLHILLSLQSTSQLTVLPPRPTVCRDSNKGLSRVQLNFIRLHLFQRSLLSHWNVVMGTWP